MINIKHYKLQHLNDANFRTIENSFSQLSANVTKSLANANVSAQQQCV